MKDSQSFKVLIIDDEVELLNVVSAFLKITGHSYLTAADGNQAFQIISSQKIDLVICDLVLPGLCGEELFYKVQNELKAKPAFIFCSGEIESPFPEKLPEGILTFIQKPFSMNDLMLTISKYHQSITV